MQESSSEITTQGSCLCSKVVFTIRGELRNIVNCHCSKCRKFHGNFGAYTSVHLQQLAIDETDALCWYESPQDETKNVRRGFCRCCGSSLFWHPQNRSTIAVAAGALDNPVGIETIGHIWCSQMADYYQITDTLSRFPKRWQEF